MIVKNEERTLSRCLDSARGAAAEIVIVDTGSTDRTPRIGESFGAKIARFDFTHVDFAAARNRSLELATGEWIMVLDADETLRPESIAAICGLLHRNQNAGYYFERVNHYGDSRKPTTDHVVRLFPNRPSYRYRGRVHETIDASILAAGARLIPSTVRIDHGFSASTAARREKNLWYIQILNEEIAADPGDHSRLDFLAAEYHQLGMFAEATEIRERIAALRPHDPEAHLRAGICHMLYGTDARLATADFEAALRLRPGYAEAQSYLDLLHRQAT
jgi:glycosyltransferase involved in cell wall biosynthesis